MEKQKQIAWELQQRLVVIAQSEEPGEEPEPIVEQDSEENTYDLQPTPPEEVVKEEASDSDEFEVSW